MKDFILSPLEQFYVLSVYDLSLVDLSYFDKIFSGLLIFFSKPFDFLSNSTEESLFGFFQIYFSGLFFFYKIIANIFLPILAVLENVLSFPLKLIVSLLSSIFSFIPYFYTNLVEFYFTYYYSNLVNLSLDANSLDNISWLNASALSSGSLTSLDVQFLAMEVFLVLSSFFYSFTFETLFYLTTKDFSYLILSLNSSSIWLLLAFFSLSFLFLTILSSVKLVATNRWQTLLEMFYQVVLNIVRENAGDKGVRFFPLIFTTFMLILGCNLLGMIPYSFTVTSHLIVTFTSALAIFVGMNILGMLKHKKHFLSLFFPPGAPTGLAPLLVFIEFVSYIFRVLSLSIRLFANLMSGHTLLKILATFSWGVVSFWGIFILPIIIIFVVTGLELAIAFLQAYIFAVLLSIYLNDAFNLH